jgi:hypothetical protein
MFGALRFFFAFNRCWSRSQSTTLMRDAMR